jgi:hypothetical protein
VLASAYLPLVACRIRLSVGSSRFAAVDFGRRELQVHVVGHQHLSVHRVAEAGGKFLQMVRIEPVVFFGIEMHGAIHAALDDVPWNARKAYAYTARHDKLFGEGKEKDESRLRLADNRGLSAIGHREG